MSDVPSGAGVHRPRVEYRFGVVLALLAITFVFMASGATGPWVPFVAVTLQGATLMAALRASDARRPAQLIALAVVVLAILAAGGLWASGFNRGPGTEFALSVLLVAAAPVAIGRSLVRRQVIDVRTVLGALCIYVLLGMFWAYGYAAAANIQHSQFFAQQRTADLADYLYFSFVTQTTVGYGDLTAITGIGRAAAVIEALIGQLYLVTVVALLVSNLGRNRQDRIGRTD